MVMIPKTERLRSPRHLAWVRSLPCSVPGCRGDVIEAHHVRTGAGVGLKPSDRYSTPLCLEHHTEGHTLGWRSFEVRYGVDLSAIAARLWVESNRERKADEMSRRPAQTVRTFVCAGCGKAHAILYGARVTCSCGSTSAVEVQTN